MREHSKKCLHRFHVCPNLEVWNMCAVPMARLAAASREKYEMSSELRAAIFGFVSFFAEAEMSVCVRVVEWLSTSSKQAKEKIR